MDFTKPVNAQGEERLRQRRWSWRKRIGVSLLVLLVGLVVLVAALPMLLSTGWGRAWVLARVNGRLKTGRRVEVTAWDLSWFGRQRLEGVLYVDERRGVQVEVSSAEVGSLWALLPFGQMRLEGEVASLQVRLFEAKAGADEEDEEEEDAARGKWLIRDMRVDLAVHGAQVMVAGRSTALVRGVEGRLSSVGLAAPVELQLKGEVAGETIWLEGRGRTLGAVLERRWGALEGVTIRAEGPWLQASGELSGEDEGAFRVKVLAEGAGNAAAADDGTGLAAWSSQAGAFWVRGEGSFEVSAPLAGQVEVLELRLPGLTAWGHGNLSAGEFGADFESAAFLQAVRPLLGAWLGKAPGEAWLAWLQGSVGSLRVQASPERVQLEGALRRASAGAEDGVLARVSGQVEGVSVQTGAFGQVSLSVEGDLGWLSGWREVLGDGLPGTLSGGLVGRLEGKGPLSAFEGRVDFALQRVAWSSERWHVAERQLVQGGARVSCDEGGRWVLREGAVRGPWGELSGEASWSAAEGAQGRVAGRVVAGKLLDWREWGRRGAPVAITGELLPEVAWRHDGAALLFEGGLQGPDDFSVAARGERAVALPFAATFAVAVEPTGVALRRLTLQSAPLSLACNGAFDPGGGELQLAGQLTPGFEAIWALPFFDDWRARGLSVTGGAPGDFTFSGPVTDGLAGWLNYGRGRAVLRCGEVFVPGLAVPGGSVEMTLAEGVAQLTGSFSVNGGELRFEPQVNVSVPPAVITLPAGSVVMRDVALTQDLLDVGLRAVNPLLPGSVASSGKLSLVVNRLRLPLAGDPAAALEADVTLQMRDCMLLPNGLLGMVLGMLHVRDRALRLPDQDFGVRVAQGHLTCDPLLVTVAGVKMHCAGETNLLTREIDYTLSVPLTRQLLGERLAKQLKQERTLEVPIYGTFLKPRMDTTSILDFLKDTALLRVSRKALEHTGNAVGHAGTAVIDVGAEAVGLVGDVADEAVELLNSGATLLGDGAAAAGEAVGSAWNALFGGEDAAEETP